MAESKYEIYAETPDKKSKKDYWEAAIGLQQVDGLQPSEYLISLAQQSVDGILSYQEAEALLYTRYENETPEEIKNRQKECDLVSGRITQLLDSPGYPLQPASLKAVHRYLFKDLIDTAGSFRTCNIYKKEPVLNGQTVKYTNSDALEETLAYDFDQEKQKSYAGLSPDQAVKRIAGFTSAIWQAHPFMEGNTRTTAVFMECYLNRLGFKVDNTMFKEHSQFFRNALVRANYADFGKGIASEPVYLQRFFQNLLTDRKEQLRNRDLISVQLFPKPGQEAGMEL